MTFAKKIMPMAVAGLIASTGGGFAQVGGGDVPSNAKDRGTMENGPGTTGMSKGEARSDMQKGGMQGGMMKKEGGMMKKDDKM